MVLLTKLARTNKEAVDIFVKEMTYRPYMYSRYQTSSRAPWCCTENMSIAWSLRGETAGFALKFLCKHWANIYIYVIP